MCGIAGAWGDFPDDLVPRMIRRLAHRGSDDEGIFRDSQHRLTLGHRRLAILDLSPAGHQPMRDPVAGTSIVFNGEIYNYLELRARLEKNGVSFRSRSDTEVLLALYREQGTEMLSLLEGMFAFALWDPGNRELFLARDGFGVKPLYFAENAKGFLFASELKALLLEPSLHNGLDPTALAQYLTYLWCPSPRLPLKNVSKLEPGTALLVREARIGRKWQFYSIPFGAERRRDAPEALARELRRTLETAVRRQMISDVPVGCFLSGGIDSSAVTALARSHSRETLQCFSVELPAQDARAEGMTDDLPYARRVAEHLGVSLHTVSARFDLADQLDLMVRQLDEPQADPAALHVFFIAALARQCGIPVLLSGAGGDDLFSGYRRHQALAVESLWKWVPRPLRRIVQAAGTSLPSNPPLSRRFRRALEHAGNTQDDRLPTYFEWCAPETTWALLEPDFRKEASPEEVRAPLRDFIRRLPRTATPLDRMLALECRFFLADHNLNYTDKMAMAHGVEVRVPFLDRDLAALAAAIPDSLRIRRGVPKWILRKALENDLPPEILHRPKTGFGVPLRAWLRGPLRPCVDVLLHPESLRRRRIFNPEAVRALVHADRAGRIDAAYTILGLICIEMWCRNFLDPPKSLSGSC